MSPALYCAERLKLHMGEFWRLAGMVSGETSASGGHPTGLFLACLGVSLACFGRWLKYHTEPLHGPREAKQLQRRLARFNITGHLRPKTSGRDTSTQLHYAIILGVASRESGLSGPSGERGSRRSASS